MSRPVHRRRPRRLLGALLLSTAALASFAGAAQADSFSCIDGKRVHLTSLSNSKLVSAEQGSPYTGNHSAMLRARTSTAQKVRTWETFTLYCLTKDTFALRASTGLYVTADKGNSEHPGMLRALAAWVTPSEKFQLTGTPSAHNWSSGFSGNLWSVGAFRYVSMEKWYGGRDAFMLRARATKAGAGERYRIVAANPQQRF